MIDPIKLQTEGFEMKSECGRVYRISLQAVFDDYAKFLVDNDGISREEAEAKIELGDVESWFYDQFAWSDVDKVGECIQEASAENIKRALNRVRGQSIDDSTKVVFADKLAAINAEALEQGLPQAPARRPRPRV